MRIYFTLSAALTENQWRALASGMTTRAGTLARWLNNRAVAAQNFLSMHKRSYDLAHTLAGVEIADNHAAAFYDRLHGIAAGRGITGSDVEQFAGVMAAEASECAGQVVSVRVVYMGGRQACKQAGRIELAANAERWYAPAGTTHEVTPESIAALLVSTEVQPGDRLILRGDYPGDLDLNCSLRDVFIDARAATLDGTLHLLSSGQGVTLFGLGLSFRGWTTRVSHDDSVYPLDIGDYNGRNGGLELHMPEVQITHCAVHDKRNNIGMWRAARNAAIRWCHLYHAGWRLEKEGFTAHGEGIYGQADDGGLSVIEGSVIHDNGDHSIALFTGASAPMKHVHIRHCTLFNDEIQLGGNSPMQDITLEDTLTYATNNIAVGFGSTLHEDATLNRNVLCMTPNHLRGLWVRKVKKLIATNNVIVGNGTTYPVYIQNPPSHWEDWTWDDNVYSWIERAGAGQYNGASFYVEGYGALDFDQWRDLTGYDQRSRFTWTLPDDNVHVRVSPYQTEAHVTVYNWSLAPKQLVTLDGLPFGRYRAVSTMNKAEGFDFEWEGQGLAFSMVNWTNSAPIAWGAPLEKTTAPQFMCWIIEVV